ncbi:rhomboid family intramembrane serine protease [Ihubacter sp. rT4E-8]|uniref:rhomboid family intramembrane serine protease n=1 Tax=unclassified Ihubacter TaxID=2633299 RepID=UPI003C7CDD19
MNRIGRAKISFNSPVILTFVSICAIALLLDTITAGMTNRLLFSVYRSSPLNPLTYVRMVGHVFGHAGWGHFSGNIIMILLIGPLLEEKYGKWNLSFIILLTAVITGVLQILNFPHTGLLGASGVVFAFIILSSMTDMKKGEIPLTFILISIIYIGGQVYQGIFVEDNVSNLTHIVGGIVGGSCGYALNRNKTNYYI